MDINLCVVVILLSLNILIRIPECKICHNSTTDSSNLIVSVKSCSLNTLYFAGILEKTKTKTRIKSYEEILSYEFRLTYFCTNVVIVTSVFWHSCIRLISLDIDDLWSVICFPTVKPRFIFN